MPHASNISYFRAPGLLVFEADIPWHEVEAIVPASFVPVTNGEINRYNLYLPSSKTSRAETLEMTSEQFEAWLGKRKATIAEGFIAEGEDGSVFLYDSKAERLYGDVKGESRSVF